jgi:D-alanyl-D-alanine carboxypeptidase
MYPASTTKILTGLLLVENTQPADVLVAPADIKKVGQSSIYLQPGERLSARDLLYAMMLRSANDACVMVGRHLAGSDKGFAAMMNQRARDLGATRSNFVTANGLHDPNHYTTARDLGLIAQVAMRHDDFAAAVMTEKFVLDRSINTTNTLIFNRNKQLTKDPTCDGIKTGYTRPAGHCFVGSAFRSGWRLITVVLNSPDWQEDHRRLLQWGFAQFKPEVVTTKEPMVRPDVPVAFTPEHALRVACRRDGKETMETRVKLAAGLERGIRVGQELGTLSLVVNGTPLTSTKLFAHEARTSVPVRAKTNPAVYAAPLLVAAPVSFLALARGRRRR